jgi:hypothetical protein
MDARECSYDARAGREPLLQRASLQDRPKCQSAFALAEKASEPTPFPRESAHGEFTAVFCVLLAREALSALPMGTQRLRAGAQQAATKEIRPQPSQQLAEQELAQTHQAWTRGHQQLGNTLPHPPYRIFHAYKPFLHAFAAAA